MIVVSPRIIPEVDNEKTKKNALSLCRAACRALPITSILQLSLVLQQIGLIQAFGVIPSQYSLTHRCCSHVQTDILKNIEDSGHRRSHRKRSNCNELRGTRESVVSHKRLSSILLFSRSVERDGENELTSPSVGSDSHGSSTVAANDESQQSMVKDTNDFTKDETKDSDVANALNSVGSNVPNDPIVSIKQNPTPQKRRRMELSWCGRDDCAGDVIREKIVGDHNEIEFENPATGQVMYNWEDVEDELIVDRGDDKSDTSGAKDYQKTGLAIPSVLILVKKNDDNLLKVAADAVRKLTAKGDIQVMLPPEVAAKFKHYFGVDNDKINLFDPKPVPGFGGNHLASDDLNYNYLSTNNESSAYVGNQDFDSSSGPDLICTLGGDGLLMYASTLFPGPCPPILCVAGGSLGFLTPFHRDEMVDSIRKSLGLIRDYSDKSSNEHGDNSDDQKQSIHGQNGFCGEDISVSNGNLKKERKISGGGTSPVGILPMMSQFQNPDDINGDEAKSQREFGADNRFCLSMRMRLDCRVINREGVVRARFNVLNEVVIDRGSSPYLAALECFCDNVHLTTVQADGVIFSTPTGSTAYSMAAGGSVVHPAVPAILVTPICPHVLSFRSMVFPDHVVLRCYVPDDARADAAVAFDGKYRRELHRGDSVQIQMSAHPVPTINRMDHSADWLTSLKRNFNFNTRARQTPL